MNVTFTFGHTVCFLIAWLRAGPEHVTAELHKIARDKLTSLSRGLTTSEVNGLCARHFGKDEFGQRMLKLREPLGRAPAGGVLG